MKYYFIALILFLFATPCLAQKQFRVSGKILFEEDSSAIYNAHIAVKGTSYGSTSNEEGLFLLSFNEKHFNDTLIISYLGYEYFTIAISEAIKKKDIKVYLHTKTMTLDDIVFKAVDAKEIVKKAINQIPTNYSKEKRLYDIHYKEIKKQDSSFVSYLEVAADLVSKGFSNDFIGAKKYTNVYLKGKRTSYNYDLTYQGGNGLFVAFWVNWARTYLSKKALKKYSFEYEGLTNYRDKEVYQISVVKPNKNEKTYLYISKDDYAILAIDTHFNNSMKSKAEANETWWFLELKLHIDFHQRGSTFYINAINDYRKSMNSKGQTFELTRTIRVLDVKNISILSNKHKITPETDLFSYPIPFEGKFWQNYNAPLETKAENKIKLDLERNGSNLKKQFNKQN